MSRKQEKDNVLRYLKKDPQFNSSKIVVRFGSVIKHNQTFLFNISIFWVHLT